MATIPAGVISSPVDFRIGPNPPEKTADAIAELYSAMQEVIQTFVNFCGIGQQPFQFWTQLAGSSATVLSGNLGRIYVKAGENISFGAMVNLFSSAGVLTARNANATNNTKPMDGFCTTVGGILSGAVGEVTLSTGIASIAGLVLGTRYYLDVNNGLVTAVAPVAAGNIEQYLGIALEATKLYVNAGYWIQH